MAIAAAAAIAGVGISVYKTLHAAHQEKVAQQEQAGMRLPFYKIQNEYYQNENLANSQAQGGFSQSAKDLYGSEAERGYGTGVQGILNAGGSANDIARLNDSFNRSVFNLAAADAQAQMQNIQYFMKANSDLGDQKTIQFLVNQKQPYENQLAQVNQRRAAAQENINQGLSDTVGSLAAFGTAIQNNNLYGNGTASSRSSDNFRPDPYGGAVAPINSPIDQSYLNERTIPAFNQNNSGASNIFRTNETTGSNGDWMGNLNDEMKTKLIQQILNHG